jgi:hypothetical protein
MKIFKLNNKIEIACDYKKTRNGFKHTAILLIDGTNREETKICYLNRTWEQYEYQSVFHQLLDKTKLLSDKQKQSFKNKIDGTDGYDGEGCKGDLAGLKLVSMVAGLGEVLGNNQKEKNDFKTRILKAGLENKGLIIPEDWNELSEDEKEKRLNGAIKELA